MKHLLILAAIAAITACKSTATERPSALREAQKDKARAAARALFSELSGRLEKAIKSGGPAAAIGVCASEAITITSSVGEAHRVKIGRTATRLRNEANIAPAWAKELIASGTAEPTFTPLPDGGLGALLPIRLKKLCETCHGDPTSFPDDLRAALAESYPDDRATGFREGDLRGWFWVEVSARP